MRGLHRFSDSILKVVIVALLIGPTGLLGPAAQAQTGPVKLEWFGWCFYRFTSPTGKIILTNPFITGNPDAAVKLEEIAKADLILVPNGAASRTSLKLDDRSNPR